MNRLQCRWNASGVWLAVCVAVFSTAATATDTDLVAAAKDVTQIVAHRGASAERPECTLAAVHRAFEVGATAVEIDVRTSQDGRLFLLHDSTLDRTTNGTGPADQLTLEELQRLDAGSSFDSAWKDERIPSLVQVVQACRGKIDLLLDLKEQGDIYDRRVADVIRQDGDPQRTIVGVRTVDQARRFRRLLPMSRQLALIPSPDTIEAFAEAGVDTIRLWPKWLKDGDGPVQRIRDAGIRLHLNGKLGGIDETIALLKFQPTSLLVDHPAQLQQSLNQISQGDIPSRSLHAMVDKADGTHLVAGSSQVGARTFLNRDYEMMEVPKELRRLPRYAFNGGDGERVRLRFREAAAVFAAFDYNDTGNWSFPDGRPPSELGWQLWRANAYRGSSNPGKDGKPNRATVWFREFKPGQHLVGLPQWWLCLGIADLKTAQSIDGFEPGLFSTVQAVAPRYSHSTVAAQQRPLHVPQFASVDEFREWQEKQRSQFVQRMLYPYEGEIAIVAGRESSHDTHHRKEFQATIDGQRLFRFFRLEPRSKDSAKQRPAIVCFMGHGKVVQVLDDENSYQHACADYFTKAGFLVYVMENVGMEPGKDTHHDLDQSLRLEGHGWYSLLFAHQRIVLDQVFADPLVDTKHVGVAGVSTGGLLALSAAVMEPRITAASVQGIFGSMRTSFIRDRNRHCRCGAIPGLLPEFDLPELALLVAPRSLHVSNGKTDGFSPEESKRCVELISPLYQRAGGKEPQFTVSPGGHEFALEPALKFFAGCLEVPSAE